MDKLKKIILRKIVSSTLVETLVASVIIILIFSFTSLILNNLFKANVNNDTLAIENRMNKLIYLYEHKSLATPFYEVIGDWEIMIEKESNEDFPSRHLKAHNLKTEKIIYRNMYYEAE
jgi:hypothetical protein